MNHLQSRANVLLIAATMVVDGDAKRMEFKTPSETQAILRKDDDLVIWVDKGSASASEVLATALQR